MPATNTANATRRRSTRVTRSVNVTVSGTDAAKQSFSEQTGTVELGSQGCKFFATRPLAKDSWLMLEIAAARRGILGRRVRARIVWLQESPELPGLFQVGVEFEAPGNVWRIPDPPSDWPRANPSGEIDPEAFEREVDKLLNIARTGTYYQLLQVGADAPPAHVKQNFYALARKFHPDHHMNYPERIESLHRVMDAITVAYRTLSNDAARRQYDERLNASGMFTIDRQSHAAQKTAEECIAEARQSIRAQNIGGSILWLRKAIDMEPNSPKYRALLARSLSAVPSFRREATEHLLRAIELDPLNIKLHLQLPELYEEMKLPWRARPHYNKVLQIDPQHAEARQHLTQLDESDGKKKDAKRSWVNRVLHPSSKQ